MSYMEVVVSTEEGILIHLVVNHLVVIDMDFGITMAILVNLGAALAILVTLVACYTLAPIANTTVGVVTGQSFLISRSNRSFPILCSS